jgi:hypothetical protein
MKYTVILAGKATVTATLDIEASSPAEAEQKAMALANNNTDHQVFWDTDDCWEAHDIEVADVTETASANRDARVDLVMAIRKHARS